MATITVRHPYDGERYRFEKEFTGVSMTKQSFKDECDINKIVDRYQRTGIIDHQERRQPRFEDCIDAKDYHNAMIAVLDAQDAFADLPAAVRKRFGNDPAALLAALEDPDQVEDLTKLGILKANPAADPQGQQLDSPPPAAEPDQGDGAISGG